MKSFCGEEGAVRSNSRKCDLNQMIFRLTRKPEYYPCKCSAKHGAAQTAAFEKSHKH